MSRILNSLRKRDNKPSSKRFGWDDLYEQLNWLGHNYPVGLQQSLPGGPEEDIPDNFEGMSHVYRTSGPVFACILARMTLFSEARFQYQRMRNGRGSELWGDSSLRILERPEPGRRTSHLLSRAEQDVSLSGNAYFHRLTPDRLVRVRPDWITIVMGSRMDVHDVSHALDAEVIAYAYQPPGERRIWIEPVDMAHWAPIPDPVARYRGMSWIGPAMVDIQADRMAATHRNSFFHQGATSNFVVLPDKDIGIEEFRDFREDFADRYEGASNAFKTIFLGGGSDVRVLGLDFEKMDFKNVQGFGETRIAAVSQVPPIIAGFSEGLSSATYSNYHQARRKFGDHFARPQWRSVSEALEPLLSVPSNSRLWYDDRDIPFLREDQGDEAKIRQTDGITVRQVLEAGFDPDAAVEYALTGNLSVLKGQHTGLVPVQLHSSDKPVLEDDPDEEDESEETEDEDVEA